MEFVILWKPYIINQKSYSCSPSKGPVKTNFFAILIYRENMWIATGFWWIMWSLTSSLWLISYLLYNYTLGMFVELFMWEHYH